MYSEKPLKITAQSVNTLIDLALTEDAARDDITTGILIPPNLKASAVLLAKAEGILAGIDVAKTVFRTIDPAINFKKLIDDGSELQSGDIIAEINGKARTILTGERTALNFLQRLSGIATLTSQFVAAVGDLPVWIVDTRKTTPGYRLLEKYAVQMGGGKNHRMNLADGILIKDNHVALLRKQGMTIEKAVKKARKEAPQGIAIEVETTNLEEVREAVKAGADIVMFDNMSPSMMKRACKLLPEDIWSEASGGVNLQTVRVLAESGVTIISVGALTHSSKALDISLELQV
ncbi:MAG TPA: carboxylating nicotinate-nucleotide diphosphorylase [Dehalococcoidales bacterium]|nr:carboxylating nicotinate-nucleotide diphosphorylase [Dehalococcoidales bacterium]